MEAMKTIIALVSYRVAMREAMTIQSEFADTLPDDCKEKLTNDITASEDRIMQTIDGIIDEC